MKIVFYFLFCLLISFEVKSKTETFIKFSCKYDKNSISKEQKNNGFLTFDKNLDRAEICRTFGCTDIIEVNTIKNQSNNNEFRLRNSWFNHQGILLDDFLITKNEIKINTFVSQAYFIESYLIDRLTGKTKRKFYKFDRYEFYYKVKEIENDSNRKLPIYNKKKLSLKTFKAFSLEPLEVFHFEGKCLEGTGV